MLPFTYRGELKFHKMFTKHLTICTKEKGGISKLIKQQQTKMHIEEEEIKYIYNECSKNNKTA